MAFINGPVPESFERRVTATPREFERDLRQAWPQVQGGADASASGCRMGRSISRSRSSPLACAVSACWSCRS
ncbi:hypothetical protein [Thauera sp.]